MLTMSQVNYIKDLHKMGYNISEISRETGRDRKTVRDYLKKEDFSPKPPATKAGESIVAPYREIILGWLEEDQKVWRKQHHTAKRIFDRLREEHGFTGSYDSVQKYVKRLRSDEKIKATQELVWEPGYAQADFGEADFKEDTTIVRRKYLTLSFPYSNDGYNQVFGGETAECVCQGLQDIFQHIGGVPRVIVFDNATGVGHRVMDKIHETDLFARFRAHYGFQIRFCNPHAGWEKGNVENKVGTTRRNIFVPVQSYHDMEEYNKTLITEHEKKAAELHYKKGVKISELFEEDKKHFISLPRSPFNVCRYDILKADGYGKVCVDGKHYYSTKPENHDTKVTVGIRAHYIDILEPDGSILVRHRRQYGENRTDSSDYSTSLKMLCKNVGAWENSGIRKEAPDLIRDYIDSLERAGRKATLNLLDSLTNQYSFKTALQALEMAIRNENVNKADAAILAARIAGYGIDTPPESGPSLKIYDDTFLNKSGEEAVG